MTEISPANEAILGELIDLRVEVLGLRQMVAMLMHEISQNAKNPADKLEQIIARYESQNFDVVGEISPAKSIEHKILQLKDAREQGVFSMAREWKR